MRSPLPRRVLGLQGLQAWPLGPRVSRSRAAPGTRASGGGTCARARRWAQPAGSRAQTRPSPAARAQLCPADSPASRRARRSPRGPLRGAPPGPAGPAARRWLPGRPGGGRRPEPRLCPARCVAGVGSSGRRGAPSSPGAAPHWESRVPGGGGAQGGRRPRARLAWARGLGSHGPPWAWRHRCGAPWARRYRCGAQTPAAAPLCSAGKGVGAMREPRPWK